MYGTKTANLKSAKLLLIEKVYLFIYLFILPFFLFICGGFCHTLK